MLGSGGRIYGSVGPKTMELVQAGHHLVRGTYLAYVSRLKAAPLVFLLSLWDPFVRSAAKGWLADVVRHPRRLLTKIRVQTIGIIQAPECCLRVRAMHTARQGWGG